MVDHQQLPARLHSFARTAADCECNLKTSQVYANGLLVGEERLSFLANFLIAAAVVGTACEGTSSAGVL